MKRLNKIAQIIIDWQKQGKSHTQDGRKPNDTRTRSIKIEWTFRINCNKLTVYAKKKKIATRIGPIDSIQMKFPINFIFEWQ